MSSRHRERIRSNSIRKIMMAIEDMTNVIQLQIGETDAKTADFIIEAAKQALDDGFTHYTANAGIRELRHAVAQRYYRKYQINVESDEVLITAGAVSALHVALLALVDVGDEVLIPDPGYPNYEGLVHIMNAHPVFYPLRKEYGFLPNAEDIAERITPFTKVIMINTPQNPTGAVYPKEKWQEILELVEKHNLFLISDEIYDEITYEQKHHCPLALRPDLKDQIIVVNGFSKGYAMTGWRLGYMIVPQSLVALLCKLLEPTTTCAAEFVQKAGIVALNDASSALVDMRSRYLKQRDLACSILDQYEVPYHKPQGALYIIVDISATGIEAEPFAMELVRTEKVMVAPGDGFGPSGLYFVRICFAGDAEQLELGVHGLGRFYRKNVGKE